MHSTFNLRGHEFTLETRDTVFTPTSTTRRLADHMEIPPGSTVLDLGCGSGPIAILAALMGAAKVYAVDVMDEAVALTLANAKRNNVVDKISATCGSLFTPIKGLTFDVIIDDVSGVADRVARISPWFPPPVPTGGSDGTELVMNVLSDARAHLNPGGAIYFPVLSLSASHKIVEHARGLFQNATVCLGRHKIPFCPEFHENIEEMEAMRDEGLIDYSKFGSRYVWYLEIWRCQVPAS